MRTSILIDIIQTLQVCLRNETVIYEQHPADDIQRGRMLEAKELHDRIMKLLSER